MKPADQIWRNIWAALTLLLLLTSGIVAQTNWEKHTPGAVFSGTPGSMNHNASQPCVLVENGIYKMWYTTADPKNSEMRIGYTQSANGIDWLAQDAPFINGGTEGYWDTYKCNVRVIRVKDTLKMWYTGYYYDLFWVVARIGYAWSVKGNVWNFHPKPVLEKGRYGAFDDSYVFSPSVIYDGEIYHMWYSARSLRNEFNIGHATSSDGIHWEKDEQNNPVINSIGKYGWYCQGIHHPTVLMNNDTLHMWFGASGYDWKKQIGHAFSVDGVNWVLQDEAAPDLGPGAPGDWDSQQVQHPYVIVDEGRYKMWYSGSNNLEGRWEIGHALGDPAEFRPGSENDFSTLTLSARPNPFSSNLIVTCNFDVKTSYSLDVFSLAGQHVLRLDEGNAAQGTWYYHYQLPELTPGIYLLVLKTPYKSIRIKMIKG